MTTRGWLGLLAAVAQAMLPTILLRKARPDLDTIVPDVVQPVPVTFSIWLPIFATSVAAAARSVATQPHDNATSRQLGWAPVLAHGSTAAWSALVVRNRFGAAQAALGVLALAAETSRVRLARAERERGLSGWDTAVVAPSVCLLAGWGAAAAGVNAAAMVRVEATARGVPTDDRFDGTLRGTALLTLLGVALWRSARLRPALITTRMYVATWCWALGGIALRPANSNRFTAATVTGAVAVLSRARAGRG